MTQDIRTLSSRARLVYGLGCITLGCFPILVSTGLLDAWKSASLAPYWVVVGTGVIFIIAGFMILMAHHSRVNDLLAAVLLMIFGILGVWASLFGTSESISGGLPFFSREINVLIGRWVFGISALISFALCAWAIRRGMANTESDLDS